MRDFPIFPFIPAKKKENPFEPIPLYDELPMPMPPKVSPPPTENQERGVIVIEIF